MNDSLSTAIEVIISLNQCLVVIFNINWFLIFSNGDSALHLMLRIRCKSSLLEMVVGKFKELGISVDVKNDKGMTPLFILCSFLDRYDDLDLPLRLAHVLLEADADRNIIIGSEVLAQLSGLKSIPILHDFFLKFMNSNGHKFI